MSREEIRSQIAGLPSRYAGRVDPIVEILQPASELDFAVLETERGWAFPKSFVDFMNVMQGFDTPGLLDVGPGVAHFEATIAYFYDEELAAEHWYPDLIPFLVIGDGIYWCLSASAGSGSPVFLWNDADAVGQIADSFASWLVTLETRLGGMA